MSIEIIQPGLQTSVQDLGRKGQMHNGVARSGAFDPVAFQMANWLVSNEDNHPALEITLLGPTLKFHCAMSIAIVGAEFELRLNGQQVFNNKAINVHAGDILSFEQPRLDRKAPEKSRISARAYLAFSADLTAIPLLNSFATNLTANFGGFKGRALKAGDILELKNVKVAPLKVLAAQYHLQYQGNYLLRCTDSVESEWFEANEWQQFFSQSYQISSESNRMGLRLRGEPLQMLPKPQLVSSGLTSGSIQIPESGEPIISAVDGQTIGGYPRLANVISADHNLLGQLKTGDKLSFVYVSRKEAIEQLMQKAALLRRVKKSLI